MAELDPMAARLVEQWRDYRDRARANGQPMSHAQALVFIAGVHVGSLDALVQIGAGDDVLAERSRSFLAAWTAAQDEQRAWWAAEDAARDRADAARADEAGEVDGL
jgi:hypothetical protein